MDNKFLLALVWILSAAVVAALVYSTWDLLKWLTARMVAGWRLFAPHLGAGCAIPVRVRGTFRIKHLKRL